MLEILEKEKDKVRKISHLLRGGRRGQDTLGGRKGDTAKATDSEKWNRYIWWFVMPQQIAQILFMEMDSQADQ